MGQTNMINEDVKKTLEKKIKILLDYMDQIKEYVAIDSDSLALNKDKRLAAERLFQLMVDEAVDISALLVYHLGGSIPDSSKSTFYELAPLKIIDLGFAEKIAESAKIRNQMTHDYEKLSKLDVVISIKKFYEMYKSFAKILVDRFIEP